MALKKFTKDPDAVLDYTVDWSDWLAPGDEIADVSTADADDGITVNSSEFTATTVTVWISGGTVGNKYTVPIHITTDGGREDDRSLVFAIKEL